MGEMLSAIRLARRSSSASKVADAFDLPGSVLDSKHDDATRSIRECHNNFQNAFRGGKIALELQRLAFVPAEEGH